jgi:hypothetical protein
MGLGPGGKEEDEITFLLEHNGIGSTSKLEENVESLAWSATVVFVR